ncbi:MAG: transporter-associated region [Geminicoccaceae bacterium]|jgi:CBS domain containing-hemolysin-like protein|nr:transporter-associated region [Geminicoccaceae bacterium]
MSTTIAVLIAVLSSAFAAAFAAADGAVLALGSSDARFDPSLRALGERRERIHRTLAFARVLAHLAAGCAIALALRFSARSLAMSLAIAVPVALVAVLLSESVARSVGDALGVRAAERLNPLIRLVERVLSPVVMVGEWLDQLLESFIPQTHVEEDKEVTAEQFRQIVAAEADVTDAEETILHGVFSLGDTAVHEIMVPRVNVVGIEQTTPWSDVLARVRSSEHARFPVFDDTLDEITGVLYAKDLLPAAIADEEPPGGWVSLVRPAVFIPGAKMIDQQLRDFQASRTHIAIVVDEFGGTAGIVTIEDILEEIVGEIRDEYDVEEASVEQEEGRRFWVPGRLTVDELSELVGHDFHREGVTTVGGLVYELLGRVPQAGESLVLDGFRVVIERVVKRRVERVYFERSGQLSERVS